MIGVIFEYLNEKVEVRIDNSNCLFRTKQTYPSFIPIDSLRIDKKGVLKEFPDLKDKDDWRKQAIKRFKEKVKSFDTEKEQIKYIMEDLKKYGYKPLYIQKVGYRPVKVY